MTVAVAVAVAIEEASKHNLRMYGFHTSFFVAF